MNSRERKIAEFERAEAAYKKAEIAYEKADRAYNKAGDVLAKAANEKLPYVIRTVFNKAWAGKFSAVDIAYAEYLIAQADYNEKLCVFDNAVDVYNKASLKRRKRR